VSTSELHPGDVGFSAARPEDLRGGDAEANARITRRILSGEDTSPRRDVVLLNAAAALVVGGKVNALQDGITLAGQSIDSGAAVKALDNLVSFTQSVAG
jgi:anthranilate phosphoribosyltransferase